MGSTSLRTSARTRASTRMLGIACASLVVGIVAPTFAHAQDATGDESPECEGRPYTFSLDAVQDRFWGFHLHGRAGIPMHPIVDLTVQANLWTSPSLAAIPAGQNLWAEIGVGARFLLLDGQLTPAIEVGSTHGSYLSDGTRGVAFDGIALRGIVDADFALVPHLALDVHVASTLYTALREESAEPRGAVWTTAAVGALLFDVVAIGPYLEHLYRWVRTTGLDENPILWLGGYVDVRLPLGFAIGFSAGIDTTPDDGTADSDFYRVHIGWHG